MRVLRIECLVLVGALFCFILIYPKIPAAAGEASAAIEAALQRAADRPPDPHATLAATRERLGGSLRRLAQFLKSAGGDVYHGWDQTLALSVLANELSRQDADRSVLHAAEQRFHQNHAGLELPQFLHVRRDIRSYLAALEYAASEDPSMLYQERISELQYKLTRLDVNFDAADCHRAGTLVAWLEALSGEGAAAARAIRSKYCRVNAVGIASDRAANLLLERKVAEQNFITDMVMGAYTSGAVYANGHVTVGILPNPRQSTLEIRLNGQASAPAMVARQRNVTVHSSTLTALRVHKQVKFDDQGLSFLPAVASAVTNMQLNDVFAPRRFVERIAWRRASRMVPVAQALASRRAEGESRGKMDAQAASMLGGINSLYRDKIRAPLVRLGGFPLARFSSDADRARVELSQWNDRQLAPASPLPKFSDDYALACGAHESMVNNFVENLLGGATTHDEGWAHAVELMTGEVPRPLWVHDRSVRWALTFADQQPWVAYFDNDRIGFHLSLTKVTRGEREIEHPVEVTIQLGPHISERGEPFLIRDGDIEVDIASGLSVEDEADLRKFLVAKIGAAFPAELYFDGFVAPSGGVIGRLRAFEVVEFRSQDGWATLGYEINESARLATALSNTTER
jgi:hypothetical protein